MWNFRRGSTMAKNLSPDKAVRVKTETPILTSFVNSEMVHRSEPYGHESNV